jgi:hypothetical protein
VIQYAACNHPHGPAASIGRNLVLDSVRSFRYKRAFSKIVPACERKVPSERGIAEIQSAVQMNAMVKHMRIVILGIAEMFSGYTGRHGSRSEEWRNSHSVTLAKAGGPALLTASNLVLVSDLCARKKHQQSTLWQAVIAAHFMSA